MSAADVIHENGTRFGARASLMIEAADDACVQSRRGFKFETEAMLFEILLEHTLDVMRSHAEETACILFEAEARLQFFGVHAPETDLTKWRRASWEAYHEIEALELARAS